MARSEAQKRADKKYESKREKRYTCWTLIFYPEGNPGAPEDWRECLADMHVKIWVSPLHDSDKWTSQDEKKNPAHKAGELKKEHYHLVVEYANQQSYTDTLEDFCFLNGTKPERVRDKNSIVRYLVHMDDLEKAQYSRDDVSCFGGATLDPMDELGTSEFHREMKAMRNCIKENGFIDFCEFYDYCDDCQENWSRLLDTRAAYAIERYIKSVRAAKRDRYKNLENQEIAKLKEEMKKAE